MPLPDEGLSVGAEVEVDVGPVAHGGHCVARHGAAGQVLFVRHTLPGERVLARVTEVGPQERYARADAVEVLRASPDRVVAPCPFSGPGRCGGCDWQHVDLAAQRRLKADVVAEQLVRLAGFTAEEVEGLGLVCEPVPGDRDGLRWRTRVEFAVGEHLGLRAHRSHRVVPLDDCLIATEGVVSTGVLTDPPPTGALAVDVVDPSVGEPVTVVLERAAAARPKGRGRATSRRGARTPPQPVGPVPEVVERVETGTGTHARPHEYRLSARGFWQVHPGAASTFTQQVLAWLAPTSGDRVLDLYSGVGLFAVPLAEAVGPQGSVLAVEADREATRAATTHLAPYPWATAVARPTAAALAELTAQGDRADLVVLDPPRTGAGRQVVEAVVGLRPRAVVYVACDPAALARDLATARQLGMELAGLRVLDAFPMTHHIECLALLVPGAASGEGDTMGVTGRRFDPGDPDQIS